jgi:hypothetical protein
MTNGNDSGQPGSTGTTFPNDDLEPVVVDLGVLLKHPDTMNRALRHFVMTRWVAALADAGLLDVSASLPLGTQVVPTKSSKNDDGTTTDCTSHHFSLFGHEVVSWSSCHTGSSTGSGHTAIEVMH